MPETTALLTMGALLLAMGAFAGLLAGLLGVGGGIILVPTFYYVGTVLGYESPQLMQMCLGTSLATIIVTSARSVSAHYRIGAVDLEILKTWAPGIVIGAAIGVMVATSLRSSTLQAIFGILGVIVGVYMTCGHASWRLGHRMPVGFTRAALSPIIGGLSVLMGIGGGSFGVPVMSLHNVPIHRAVATAAGFGLAIAVPSVIGFLLTDTSAVPTPPMTIGAVNLAACALVISMTLITAPWGAALAHRTNAAVLRKVFGVFLILVALNMLRKALGL